MKLKIAAVLLFAAATWAMAFDVPVRWPDGRIREGYPKRIGAVVNPTPETCAANGYPLATKAEVEAQDKADAKADADALAQAQAAEAAIAADKAFKAAKLDSAAAKGAKAKDADIAAAFADLVDALKEKK